MVRRFLSELRRRRGWRLILFARCEDSVRAASDELDGPVEADRRWAGRLHAMGCPSCRRERSWLRWLGRQIERQAESAPKEPCKGSLSPEAAERMRAALDAARHADH